MKIMIGATKQDHSTNAKKPKALDGLEAIIVDGKVIINALCAGKIYKGAFADDDLIAFATVIKDNIKFELDLGKGNRK